MNKLAVAIYLCNFEFRMQHCWGVWKPSIQGFIIGLLAMAWMASPTRIRMANKANHPNFTNSHYLDAHLTSGRGSQRLSSPYRFENIC